MNRQPPVRVQEWVDSLSMSNTNVATTNNNVNRNVCHSSPKIIRGSITRDLSIQSENGSSHCSSIESMLELRKPDPEAVLIGLGFGPSNTSSSLSRIPQRFLGPSKLLSQFDISKFIDQQSDSNSFDQKFNSTPASPARPRPSM